MKTATHDAAGYARVPTTALRAIGKEGNDDLRFFLPTGPGGDPVLYHRGDPASEPDVIERMVSRGLSHIYVEAKDFHACAHALESHFHDIMLDPSVPAEEKAIASHEVGASVARGIIDGAVTPEKLARASALLDTLVEGMLLDPQIASYVINMAGHERSTASHMVIVASLAVALGAQIYGSHAARLRALGTAGLLHDLGKLAIPSEILNKTEPLTREDLALIHDHPVQSVRLIGDEPRVCPLARQIILQHHERVDGKGYPLGLPDEALLAGSKLLSIVDSFHALVGKRAYRATLQPHEANRVLSAQAGKQFDGEFLKIWLDLCERNWQATTASTTSQELKSPLAKEPETEDSGNASDHSVRHEYRVAVKLPKTAQARRRRYSCNGELFVRARYLERVSSGVASPSHFTAWVEDISGRGVGIVATHPMYRNERVHLRMEVKGRAIDVDAKVMWCRLKQKDLYRVGLHLVGKMPSELQDHQTQQDLPATEPAGGASRSQAQSMADAASSGSLPNVEAHSANPGTHASQTPMTGTEQNLQSPDSDIDKIRIPHDPPRERARYSDRQMEALQKLGAIQALRRTDREAQQTVAALAMAEDPVIAVHAIGALADIGTTMARQAVLTLLNAGCTDVRARAIEAAGRMRIRDAVPILREKLNDRALEIALRAVGSLGLLGDKSGLRFAAERLDENTSVGRLALIAVSHVTGHRFPVTREGFAAARRYLIAKNIIPA